MLHMGYSSPSLIALDYDFTFLYKKMIPFSDIGGDMIAFISEKHHSSFYLFYTYRPSVLFKC